MSPPISCPVVRVPEVVPCESAELDELVAFLESEAGIEEERAFMRGTLLPDGRLDLCKQSVGAQGCARIVSALQFHPWVKSVLLGTDAIGDEGALAVAGLIETNPRLEVVYLGCNGISESGVAELSRSLQSNTSVKGFWLKRNPIGDGGMRSLGTMLQENTNLSILDVVNCGFGPQGLTALCQSLRDGNRALKRLYLGSNGSLSAQLLRDMLAANPVLEGLFLNVGALGDAGASELARGVGQSHSLRELGAGSNGIGLLGLKALCATLSDGSRLEVLDLGRAASQTVLGAQGNDFRGGGAIIGEMLRSNRSLRRLNLRGTKLSGIDLEPVFDAVARHPKMGELMVDVPLRPDVKARLADNRKEEPLQAEGGVQLIKSVYRTAKTKN